MSIIKVGLIEDDIEFAQSLKVLINGSFGFECSQHFATVLSAIESIPNLNLDVVLTDISLPDNNGILAIKTLKPLCKNTEFLICSVFEDTDNIVNALKAGATGYITKTTSPAQILDSIRDVYNGGSPMNSLIARKVINSFQFYETNKNVEILSSREKQILNLLSQGLRYKDISNEFFISIETVRTHVRNIYKKLEVNSKNEAIAKLHNKQ